MAVSFEMRFGIVAEDDCRQPKCCGAFCKTHTPQNLKLTYLAIEKALGKIATSNGSAASVSSRDMVIAVHCKGGAGSKYVFFHKLLAAWQCGHHAPWQVCALLDCLEGDVGPPLEGLLLQYGLREFVRPNNPPPHACEPAISRRARADGG